MSSPVVDAAMRGDLAAVRSLIEQQGRSVEEKDGHGYTPLLWAARKGHLPVVAYLVERGANMQAKDKNAYTALMRAAMKGHLPVVEYLLERGADMEAKNNIGDTPLMVAAENGRLPVVAYLLERGADIERKSRQGQSALHLVSNSNFDKAVEIVATLLKYGADLSAVDQAGETALQRLAKKFTRGNEAQLIEAIQKGQLIVAVKSGDIAGVQRCQGVDTHTRDHNGVSMLAHAARRGDPSMFEYLVERGADTTSDDEEPEDRDMIAAMLQRRQEWIDQAVLLTHRWHVPLTAVRTIHEYVVGFNWSAVLDGSNA